MEIYNYRRREKVNLKVLGFGAPKWGAFVISLKNEL